jgi:hypothetical protein
MTLVVLTYTGSTGPLSHSDTGSCILEQESLQDTIRRSVFPSALALHFLEAIHRAYRNRKGGLEVKGPTLDCAFAAFVQ